MGNEIVLKRPIFILCMLLLSCSNDKKNEASPFSIIVSLESAESFRDYEAAKQYIDVEKVYGDISVKENKSPEVIWREYIDFNYSLGNSSRKFSECFPFYKYKVVEEDLGNVFKITLIGDKNKSLFYELINKNNKWVVVKRNS